MRVLFVDLEREWRGGQSQALLTLRGLRECELQAELVAARDSPLAMHCQQEGITVHEVPRLGLRPAAAWAIRKLLAHGGFELLHANEPHALTAAWLGGASSRVPVVASRRVAYPLQQNALARKRYSMARRILAVSHFVEKSVIKSGISPEKVEVVYDGVELPSPVTEQIRGRARQRWGVNKNDMLLGCVGYLLPEKGQELAVRALSSVRQKIPNARLLLAGDGPCRKMLETLTRRLGLQQALIFAGFVEDVTQVYAALDLFLFPSLAEPLGTSLLTAMAWGLPVLAVASGGVPEYVDDGNNGLLVAQPVPELFATATIRYLSDQSLRERLGQAARSRIENQFSAQLMVSRTIQVYQDVSLAIRPPSPRSSPRPDHVGENQ